MKPLSLATKPRAEEDRCFPHKFRELGQVPEKLLGTFRELVAGREPWPLFLHGDVGVGKTAAVLALTDYLPGAVYMTAPELATKHLAQVNRTGPMVPWELITGKRCPLLVIDELGTRKNVTDTAYEALQKAIDARDGWPLILVSNLDANALAQLYDDRIASRVLAGCSFNFTGKDRRTG